MKSYMSYNLEVRVMSSLFHFSIQRKDQRRLFDFPFAESSFIPFALPARMEIRTFLVKISARARSLFGL